MNQASCTTYVDAAHWSMSSCITCGLRWHGQMKALLPSFLMC